MKIELPSPIKSDSIVEIRLPNEVITLLQDLHNDREYIGYGGMILLACVVLCSLKNLFKKG